MTGQCACCGEHGPAEVHHIGRRSHSRVTINVCPECHSLLTIADVYERSWKPEASPVWRVAAGFLDIMAVLAANAGLPVCMRLVGNLRDSLPGDLVTARVSPSVPEYPGCDDAETCTRIIDDALEMWRADVMGAVR